MPAFFVTITMAIAIISWQRSPASATEAAAEAAAESTPETASTESARCSYIAMYPPAVGRHTFLMAKATSGGVTAMIPFDALNTVRPRKVRAQIMDISEVAGSQSMELRYWLKDSGGTAVFVRYDIGMSCGPSPAADGRFDSVGVNGLYVGILRPAEQWADGRPTFDVYRAAHFPLPQRLSANGGHLVFTVNDSTPTMAASELFSMYRALWTEEPPANDTSVERRLRGWIKSNPRIARMQPAKEVAFGILEAISNHFVAQHTVPFGGTFAITVVVPGVDSVVLQGQTSLNTRVWLATVVRDSSTGVPVALARQSFAIDITTTAAGEGSVGASGRTGPCAPNVIVVDSLPIVPDASSSWRGSLYIDGFLQCVPSDSKLFRKAGVESGSASALAPTTVTFHQDANGHVTFEAVANRNGQQVMFVRGERVSTWSSGSKF